MANSRKQLRRELPGILEDGEYWYIQPGRRDAGKTEMHEGDAAEAAAADGEAAQNINRNAGHRARLRERFRENQGFEGFSDHEVLELLLTFGAPRKDMKDTAKDLLETFGEVGKEVVTVSPTFEIYWVCCSLLGLKHKPVQYNADFTISIESILNAMTNDTRVVVLLNPNSPIGNLYSDDEVHKVIDKAKQIGAVVILDEAYHYFYDKTFLHFALENDNVVLLRTFSKLMSIAGLRVGMIVGHKDLIHWVRNSRLAYEMNSIGLLFAERILEHPEMIDDLIRQEKEGKTYFIGELEKRGYWYMDCRGNYVLVKPKHNAHEVSRRLAEEKKTLVHPYGNAMMKDMLRVTVGSVNAMEFFTQVFFEVDKD